MKNELSQYFTPSWAADLLVRRHFANLGPLDTVLEPSCGDGRFLLAIPEYVDAYGVEIDAEVAVMARNNTGREVIVCDFTTAKLPRRPTVVIGNPPYVSDVIDAFIDRCYHELDYGGRIGFMLPVYYLQTASKVVDLSRKWSLSQELLPRNLFERITKPIMWCNFIKEQRTVLSGFFLYSETDSVSNLKSEIRSMVLGNKSTANCWRDVIALAMKVCGGRAKLTQLYECIESNRPTNNPWWREKIRQIVREDYIWVAPGEYAVQE